MRHSGRKWVLICYIGYSGVVARKRGGKSRWLLEGFLSMEKSQ
jgi:hypothetical protein